MNLPPNSTEIAKPDLFADFLVAYAQSTDKNICKLARSVGLPERVAFKIVKRLEGLWQPVTEEVKRVTTDGLVKEIEGKLPLLLDGVTAEKVKDATLRDVSVAFGVLVEKRQLLKGEPTQILTYEERSNLNHLLPAIQREIQRRGMTIDAEYREVHDINVVQPENLPEEALSKTAAEKAKREKRAKNR